MEDGTCLLWHGEEALCQVIKYEIATFVRLLCDDAERSIWIFPEEYFKDWLIHNFAKGDLQPGEADLLANLINLIRSV